MIFLLQIFNSVTCVQICTLKDKNIMSEKADNLLSNMTGSTFIFNLSHGILYNTPLKKMLNVEFLVNRVVREFRC